MRAEATWGNAPAGQDVVALRAENDQLRRWSPPRRASRSRVRSIGRCVVRCGGFIRQTGDEVHADQARSSVGKGHDSRS